MSARKSIIYMCVCVCNQMETQTWLSRHYKFILVENITVLSVSSDDFLHAFLEVAKQQKQWTEYGK